MISGPIQPQSFCDFMLLIFRCASLTSRGEKNSRHRLLLLLAPGVPSQQSQWALWVPSPGFSLVPGSSALGTLYLSWVQYLMGFASEFKSRLAATHTAVQGWQEDSTHKMSAGPGKPVQFPWQYLLENSSMTKKAGNSYGDIFLILKLWSLSNTCGQRWCWGLQILSCRCASRFPLALLTPP